MTGSTCDVAVIGGGLGGLATAALLAKRGLDVLVLERASATGGRAATHERAGILYNEGAHALYRMGAAARVLGRLGVRWQGRRPPASGLALLGGRAHALPSTPGALLTTGLLSWSAKTAGARLFARLGGVDPRPLASVTWEEWLAREIPDPALQDALGAFVRVSTYANAQGLSAGAVLAQLRLAQAGVDYVDGGWGTLVGALLEIARGAGAVVQTHARAVCAVPAGDAAGSRWRVRLDDAAVDCRSVVLATGPDAARTLVASEALARWAHAAVPARAACLDVALSSLPAPRATFALGVDRPVYLSVHTRTARLAPRGVELVSLMKYLPAGTQGEPTADLAELEGVLDRLQPGWREVTLDRRWLPSMVAANAVVLASAGGLPGRPRPEVPDARGAYVVGDWVGAEGMLLDASLASAERAADAISGALAVERVA